MRSGTTFLGSGKWRPGSSSETWRTHSCVPRRDSSRRRFLCAEKASRGVATRHARVRTPHRPVTQFMRTSPRTRVPMASLRILCTVIVFVLQAGAENAADWVRQARDFKAKGDAASALRAFERANSLDPASAEIEDEIGFLLAATNRQSEAIPRFQKAVQLD